MNPYRPISTALRKITQVKGLLNPWADKGEYFRRCLVTLTTAHNLLDTALKQHKKEHGYKAKRKTKTRARQLYEELNGKGSKRGLWGQVVVARAGYKCEYCGAKDKVLNAHHIFKKPNYWLRFDLSNGVCLCSGCHKRKFHGERERELVDWPHQNLNRMSSGTYLGLKNRSGKPDLGILKITFEKELATHG